MTLELTEVVERSAGHVLRNSACLVEFTGVIARARRTAAEPGAELLLPNGTEMKVTDSLQEIRSQVAAGGVEGP